MEIKEELKVIVETLPREVRNNCIIEEGLTCIPSNLSKKEVHGKLAELIKNGKLTAGNIDKPTLLYIQSLKTRRNNSGIRNKSINAFLLEQARR